MSELYKLHITAEGLDFGLHDLPQRYTMWSETFYCATCDREWGRIDWLNHYAQLVYRDCENCTSERARWDVPGSLLPEAADFIDVLPRAFLLREFWLHLVYYEKGRAR